MMSHLYKFAFLQIITRIVISLNQSILCRWLFGRKRGIETQDYLKVESSSIFLRRTLPRGYLCILQMAIRSIITTISNSINSSSTTRGEQLKSGNTRMTFPSCTDRWPESKTRVLKSKFKENKKKYIKINIKYQGPSDNSKLRT